MKRALAFLFFCGAVFCRVGVAQEVPTGNPYDVLAKLMQPFFGVFLGGEKAGERAMELEAAVEGVQGRLPQQFVGARLKLWVQYPDKLRMELPVGGERLVIVRNGKEVWVQPGDKVEFLLSQFRMKPQASPKNNTPLAIPFTAQQAVFAIMLFDVLNREIAEVDEVGGVRCRVLPVMFQPEIGKALKATDFKTTVWVDGSYRLRRMEVERRDFRMTVGVAKMAFYPSLPANLWQEPEGATNIYRTGAEEVEALLYVGLNSLQMSEKDQPWKYER